MMMDELSVPLSSKVRTTGKAFPITITAKMRHGLLWEARKRFGSNRALAEFLGVPQTVVGRWMNLQKVPHLSRMRHEVQQRLMEATGCTMDEVFPESIRTHDFLDAPKEFERVRFFESPRLVSSAAVQALSRPDQLVERSELKRAIAEALETLSPMEQEIIRLRFGLGEDEEHTFEGIASKKNISSNRVMQIEAKALRLLRHPSRSRMIRAAVDGSQLSRGEAQDAREQHRFDKKIYYCAGSRMMVAEEEVRPRHGWVDETRCPICKRMIAVAGGMRRILPHVDRR